MTGHLLGNKQTKNNTRNILLRLHYKGPLRHPMSLSLRKKVFCFFIEDFLRQKLLNADQSKTESIRKETTYGIETTFNF